jgi:ABC-type phosphate/phosphonate transport system substrate-binding protein
LSGLKFLKTDSFIHGNLCLPKRDLSVVSGESDLMIRRSGFTRKLLNVAAFLLLPQLAYTASFTIGSINTAPMVESAKFWPLVSYLERQLRSEGIDDGKIVVAESIPAMSAFLKQKQVDLYIDSFFPSLAVSRLSGSSLMLRRWKLGKSEYSSVIFTQKNNGIARLEDLKGKIIAFETPFSSTGYFFPKIALLEKGLRLMPKRYETEPVRSDEVGYIFAHNDAKAILMVMSAIVAAGATDNQKYLTVSRNVDNLKVIHETDSFSRHIVSYRADLPTKLVTRVKEVLLNMHQSEEGRQALAAFENTTKFEELPTRDIDLMAKLRKYVDAELKIQNGVPSKGG